MDPTSTNLPVDVYARVSKKRKKKRKRGDERESREMSTAGQVAVCQERLRKLGLPEGEVLIDPGRSAWDPSVKREGWDTLMDRLETGVSGGVIIFDLERFTRQPPDGERLIRLAGRVAVLDSESDYDLTTPNGKKAFRDALTAAAYYSDRLSTRVRRGLKMRAFDGEPHGSLRPFGFEPDKVTVRESEAAILRELTARFLAGEAQKTLVDDLNAREIRTSQGRPFRTSNLKQLLTRSVNCGRLSYTDPETGVASVVARLPGKPIVSEEDFDLLCAVYASRRRGRPNSPKYLCSAIAVCGQPVWRSTADHAGTICGRPLYGRPRADMKPYADGEVRRHYWCANASGGCGRTAVDQRALDKVARTLVVEIMSDPRNKNAIEEAARKISSEAARLDTEIADAEAVAAALADRLGRGEMTLARYDIAVAPLDQRIARLKAERGSLAPAEPEEVPQEVTRKQWYDRWDSADPKGRRNLLKMALRGKHLLVAPAERGAGSDDADEVMHRVTIE